MTVPPTQASRGASYGESHILPAMRLAIIAGGVAGAHVVTGIKVGDVINEVLEQDGVSGLLVDLTSEFSITAADTIDNTGGTDTSGDFLIVRYFARSDFGGPDLGRN